MPQRPPVWRNRRSESLRQAAMGASARSREGREGDAGRAGCRRCFSPYPVIATRIVPVSRQTDRLSSVIAATAGCGKTPYPSGRGGFMNYPLVVMQTAVVSWRPPERNVGPSRRPQATDLIVVDGLTITGNAAYRRPQGRIDQGKRDAAEPGRYVDIWV